MTSKALPYLKLKKLLEISAISDNISLSNLQNHTQFIVPAETVRSFSLNTGSDSPVSMDSSTTLLPARTLPCGSS